MIEVGHANQWASGAAGNAGEPLGRQPQSRGRREQVYRPAGEGDGAPWREMWTELRDSRELCYRLFMRDFTARYRQSALGYLWALAPALATVATFSALREASVLPGTNTHLPYPLFVLLGVSVWQLFASGLTMSTQSLVFASSFITKINFPRETLVLSAFGLSLFEYLIRWALVALACVVFHVIPPATALLAPLVVLPLALLTLGLGLLLSMLNAITRDVGQIISFALPFWMLLSPIAYDTPRSGVVAQLARLNPVSPFITAVQDLFVLGRLSHPMEFGAMSLFSVLVFAAGWRIFHAAEPRIAELV